MLAEILKKRPLCLVNLIPYNTTGSGHKSTVRENINKFSEVLKKKEIKHTIRHRFGGNIDASCGQLKRSLTRTEK
jgi:23S rRNA (adenine2503-C2)-methyltransferase